jgi:HEAT repeat protein
MVRAAAASSLGQFGADAQPALSSLRAACTNENEYVQRLAKETLLKIAPEAPTNALPQ